MVTGVEICSGWMFKAGGIGGNRAVGGVWMFTVEVPAELKEGENALSIETIGKAQAKADEVDSFEEGIMNKFVEEARGSEAFEKESRKDEESGDRPESMLQIISVRERYE